MLVTVVRFVVMTVVVVVVVVDVLVAAVLVAVMRLVVVAVMAGVVVLVVVTVVVATVLGWWIAASASATSSASASASATCFTGLGFVLHIDSFGVSWGIFLILLVLSISSICDILGRFIICSFLFLSLITSCVWTIASSFGRFCGIVSGIVGRVFIGGYMCDEVTGEAFLLMSPFLGCWEGVNGDEEEGGKDQHELQHCDINNETGLANIYLLFYTDHCRRAEQWMTVNITNHAHCNTSLIHALHKITYSHRHTQTHPTKGPFKNDVTAKMRFVTTCQYPLPPCHH